MAKVSRRGGNTGRDRNQDDCHGRKGPEKTYTTKILVGTPWPEGIKVDVKRASRDAREGMVIVLTALFSGLLVAFVVYGMIMSHEYLLKHAFGLVQYGIGAVGVWAIGRKALQYVGTVGHDEDKSA